MKLAVVPVVLLFLAVAPRASAVITLGKSTQNFTLTGIGPNAQGQGQSKMSWGACVFDGTTTTCTLSGSYTGLGPGGSYAFIVSYSGNGPFPLNAINQPGSDLFFAQAVSNYDFVITLTPITGAQISFYSFANFNFLYSGPTCTGVPATSCSLSQVGATANATITGPITGSFNPAPTISPSGVISAGNYGGFPDIAPGTWVEIYGFNLANVRSQTWGGGDFVGNQAPSALGGTTVTVAGKAAYVDFVSPGQVNVQVPSGIPSGTQSVIVTTAGGSSLAYPIKVNTVEPGLLAPPAFIINGSQHVAALFSNTLTFVLPVAVSGVSTSRARAGDSITLYGIGFGTVTPDIPAGQIVDKLNQLQPNFQITFAGVSANVTYKGLAPNFVGLYQFNVTVPKVTPSDTVPVAYTLDGVPGPQNLVIAIQN